MQHVYATVLCIDTCVKEKNGPQGRAVGKAVPGITIVMTFLILLI